MWLVSTTFTATVTTYEVSEYYLHVFDDWEGNIAGYYTGMQYQASIAISFIKLVIVHSFTGC